MGMDEAEGLANSRHGAMIAPAGCGKTQIVATAVAKYGGGRELVLTHTHAGVDALRARLVNLQVASKAYHIDTIAVLALRLAASFPRTAELLESRPRTSAEWNGVYAGARRLLALPPIQEIIRASYSGTYVDEYQDCTEEQHALVLGLMDVLPCRVVGDPLQGIFAFGKNAPVRWDEHVAASFIAVPGPTRPWRWEKRDNAELGNWLQDQRRELEAGCGINLGQAPSSVTRLSDADFEGVRKRCFELAGRSGETVVVIRAVNAQCHEQARLLSGLFSCVEPIDCQDLFSAAEGIAGAHGFERAAAVIEFASTCMTETSSALKSMKDAFLAGRSPNRNRCKHVDQLDALLAVASGDRMIDIVAALEAIRHLPETPSIFRRELLNEMIRALKATHLGEWPSLVDAAWEVRSRTRIMGRKLARCSVGTTLLVKGLEFDHALVLDADALDAQNLYVAITRGARTLTVVSKEALLRPKVRRRQPGSPPKSTQMTLGF